MVDGNGIECVDGCINVEGNWIECVDGCVDGGGFQWQDSTIKFDGCRQDWRRYSMVQMAFSPVLGGKLESYLLRKTNP